MPGTPQDEVTRRLSEYPADALAYISQGVGIASRLPQDIQSAVLQQLIADFKRGKRRVSGSTLAPLTGLVMRDAERLASAYSIIIGLLSESEASAEQFAEAARNKLFNEEDELTAFTIATLACEHRDELKAGIERAQLAGAVLPSLIRFELEVDFRVRVSEGTIKTGVPIAVVHIDTDATAQEMWLQLSRGDVEDMIKKLNDTLESMNVAETLASQVS